jgi:hypothetical protein
MNSPITGLDLGGPRRRDQRPQQPDKHVFGIVRLKLSHPVRYRDLGLVFGQWRSNLRIDHRPADDVDEIEERQKEARKHRSGVKLHHRLPGHRRIDDDHHGRRDENTERAACRDDAGGELHIVARLEHGIEGDHAHQHHHGAHQAAGDAPECAHDQRRNGERGRHFPERELDAVEHLVDQRAALHHVAHEHEQRDGDQNVIRHRPIGALDHQVEHLVVGEEMGRIVEGDEAEEHSEAHQGEGRREPHHDHDHDEGEHQ